MFSEPTTSNNKVLQHVTFALSDFVRDNGARASQSDVILGSRLMYNCNDT
jgi:hypothetical protein